MQDDILFVKNSAVNTPEFSILIPTWNNLDYLLLCVDSIRENSAYQHQIIVIINEGSDGTLEWVAGQSLDYVYSKQNLGICRAMNSARPLVASRYIVYINDDMFMLPGWDKILIDEIATLGTNYFMLSCTMLEPVDSGNPCVIASDFGRGIDDFRKEELIASHDSLSIPDWCGSTWPPTLIPAFLWDIAGGLSIEFSPGMYSDPDLSMKLWTAGVRIFKGCGKSHCYHFGSRTTKRIVHNKGRKTFIRKWGISSKTFIKYYLHSGEPFGGTLAEPRFNIFRKFLFKIKRIINSF